MRTSVQAPVEIIAAPSVRTVDKTDASRQLAALDAQLAEHLTKADLDALVSMTTGIIGITDPDPAEDLEPSLISGLTRARSSPLSAPTCSEPSRCGARFSRPP